jgi:hypothetical protein
MKKEDELKIKRSRSSLHGMNGENHQPSDWNTGGRYLLYGDTVFEEKAENNLNNEEKNWQVGYEELSQLGRINWVPGYFYSELVALNLVNNRNIEISVERLRQVTWFARKKPEEEK